MHTKNQTRVLSGIEKAFDTYVNKNNELYNSWLKTRTLANKSTSKLVASFTTSTIVEVASKHKKK